MAKVAMRETGTASAGMRVARHPWRKMKTTMMTRIMASKSVVQDLLDTLAHGEGRIEGYCVIQIRGKRFFCFFHQFCDPVSRLRSHLFPAAGRVQGRPRVCR